MAELLPPLITLEEHFIPERLLPSLSDLYGEQLHHLPGVSERLTDLGASRITNLDENHISVQVVSHAPGLGTHPLSSCRLANDELAEAVRANPTRLAGLAVLPVSAPNDAAAELRRAVRDLGFRGALVDAHAGGVHFDAQRFRPLFAAASELRVPIYLHPAHPTATQQSATYDGDYGVGAARSLGTSGFGWHQDAGLGLLKLFAAGVFDELPDLQVVLGHFGEMLPFVLERVEKLSVRWGARRRGFRQVWDENVWVTTSGVWGMAPMACVLRNTKIERILYSVDYPFEKNENGLRWMEELRDSGLVTHEGLRMIAYKNAEGLLGIKASMFCQ